MKKVWRGVFAVIIGIIMVSCNENKPDKGATNIPKIAAKIIGMTEEKATKYLEDEDFTFIDKDEYTVNFSKGDIYLGYEMEVSVMGVFGEIQSTTNLSTRMYEMIKSAEALGYTLKYGYVNDYGTEKGYEYANVNDLKTAIQKLGSVWIAEISMYEPKTQVSMELEGEGGDGGSLMEFDFWLAIDDELED